MEGETGGMWCAQHRPRDAVNVVTKLCAHDSCTTIASFNRPGHEPKWCAELREPGTVCKPTRRCLAPGCRALAILGSVRAEFCEQHGNADVQRNWVEQKCAACGLEWLLGVDGLCEYCDPQAMARGRLQKQNEVYRWLLANSLALTSCDRMVDRGECGRERPDFMFDFGTHVFILEVDEHQHASYDKECERIRMVKLHQAFGGLRDRFVRYNPYAYRVDGVPQNMPYRQRAGVLRRVLEFAAALPPDVPLSVCKLFYDGADVTPFHAIAVP